MIFEKEPSKTLLNEENKKFLDTLITCVKGSFIYEFEYSLGTSNEDTEKIEALQRQRIQKFKNCLDNVALQLKINKEASYKVFTALDMDFLDLRDKASRKKPPEYAWFFILHTNASQRYIMLSSKDKKVLEIDKAYFFEYWKEHSNKAGNYHTVVEIENKFIDIQDKLQIVSERYLIQEELKKTEASNLIKVLKI